MEGKHEVKDHKIENCKALKTFLDQLVQAKHLKEFVDQEKTKAKEVKVRPNLRFDHNRDEAGNGLEKNLPLKTIHMIEGLNHPKIENINRWQRLITQNEGSFLHATPSHQICCPPR